MDYLFIAEETVDCDGTVNPLVADAVLMNVAVAENIVLFSKSYISAPHR